MILAVSTPTPQEAKKREQKRVMTRSLAVWGRRVLLRSLPFSFWGFLLKLLVAEGLKFVIVPPDVLVFVAQLKSLRVSRFGFLQPPEGFVGNG